GPSSISVSDATLGGYSMKTILKIGNLDNPHYQSSIYFYWDDPPQAVFDLGEPVWYRFDPPIIPVGGVGRGSVRCRSLPVPQPLAMEVVTSGGTVATNIPVDANTPRVASIGYSEDR